MAKSAALKIADTVATAFAVLASPVLRKLGQGFNKLPGYMKTADRLGFQIRSTHYYEPTYTEGDLPDVTTGERDLPGLNLNEAGQLALLAQFGFADELAALPARKANPASFGHDATNYALGDAESFYSIVRLKKPKRIFEIGSGNSTLVGRLGVAANQKDDPAYTCAHVCVEPYEMPWLESTGVSVIRKRVQDLPLDMFDALEAGDILFVDSSHIIRPWGDVLWEFQYIIPRLKPGVLVHVHDIFTPRDYPELWLRQQRRLWNEQYLLETMLAHNPRYRILFATNWIKHNHFAAYANAFPFAGKAPDYEPGSFWFEVMA